MHFENRLNSNNPLLLETKIGELEKENAFKQEKIDFYESIIDNVSHSIEIASVEGALVYVNESACRRLGYHHSELLRMSAVDLDPDWSEENWKQFVQTIEQFGNVTIESRHRRKDGSVFPVEVTANFIPFKGKEYIFSYVTDITGRREIEEEKNKLEEQLFQAQKMESIGRLAGGIAHDFNNTLTGIMGYAELLHLKFKDSDTTEAKATKVILKNARRSAALVKQLLGFSRKGDHDPRPLNINDLIKETVKVSEKIFEKNINVIYDLENEISSINADKNQVHQVLTNLFINAKDAMPGGGELTIRTENGFIDKNSAHFYPDITPGRYVKITVTDTGTGIPKDIKNHIFEPFFTTKEEGKGTGLGLASVYAIIKKHKGHISCYSEPGEGTTFNIYMPISENETFEEEKEETSEIIKGNRTVLVIDDEEEVRSLGTTILEKLGHNVYLAANGNEAAHIYKKHKNKIDLVILDMIMPGQSCKETLRELKMIDPNVRVLLTSGYGKNSKAREILDEGAHGFLQKPWDIRNLAAVVSTQRKKGVEG
jgi:PAS domain S-box-containing protein